MNIKQFADAVDGISDRHILACADIKSVDFSEDDEDGKGDIKVVTENQTHTSSVRKISAKRKTFKSLLLVAVITALIACLTMAVSSEAFILNLRTGIFELTGVRLTFVEDNLKKIPEKITPKSGLIVDELKAAGIPDIMLPTALLGDDWNQYYRFTTSDADGSIINTCSQLMSKETFNLTTLLYIDHYNITQGYKRVLYSEIYVERAESIVVNGIEVIVSQLRKGYKILYIVDNGSDEHVKKETVYTLFFDKLDVSDFTFEDVVEIAKTIA